MALLLDTEQDYGLSPQGTSNSQKLSDYVNSVVPSYGSSNKQLGVPEEPKFLGNYSGAGNVYQNADGSFWSTTTGTTASDPRTSQGPQEPAAPISSYYNQAPLITQQQPSGIQAGQQWLGDNTPLGTVWKNPDGSFWSTATGTVNQDELLSQWDKEVAQQAATQLGPTEASQQDYYKLRPPTPDMAQPTGNIQSITPEQATEFRNKFNAENPPQEDWWKPISGLASNIGSGLKDIGTGLYGAVEGTKEANPEQVLGGASQVSTGIGETLGAPFQAAGRLGQTLAGTAAAGITGAVEAQRQLVNALGADVKPIDYGVSPEDILHPGRTGQQYQNEVVQPNIEMIRQAPIPDALGGSKTADYLATAAEIGVSLSENPLTYMSPAAASAAEKLAGMGLQGRVAAKVLSFIGDQGDAASQLVMFEAGGLAMKAAQDAGITDEGLLTLIALGAGGLAGHFKAHELSYEEAAMKGLDKLRDNPVIQRAIQQYKEAPESGEFRFRTAKPEEPVVEPAYTITPRKYEDVPVGTSGIENALDIANKQVHQKGDIAKGVEDIPIAGRGLNAIANAIDPGINMTPEVKTAQAAAVGTRAMLTTEYVTNTREPVKTFNDAIQANKPLYIGPRARTPEEQALHFTTADIVEHPSDYILSDKQLYLLRQLDDRNWANVINNKKNYGVDISPYHTPDPNGGYIPHVASRASSEVKMETAAAGLVNASKEREYPTLRERVIADPSFKPETDIRELTRIHNESLARLAANNVFSEGVGGKTPEQVKEEGPGSYRDYTLNKWVNKYLPNKINDEVNSLYNRGGKNWQRAIAISDELRGFHLAGDASPFTIQGMLGILSDPVTAAHMFYHAVTTARPRQELFRLAREEPDMVAEYTRSTGVPFAAHGTEEFTTSKGVGHFAPIGRSEDYMFDVLSLAKYHMWQNDRNLLLKMNKGMDPHVASMDAAHLGALTIPSLNPTERFVSPERRGIERIGFTSLSFATTPAILTKDVVSGITKAASSGIAKIITSRKVDPAEIWGSMSGREQLAVIHMAELAGSLSAIAAGSAALAASSRGMSPEDAIKEAFDPNSRYFLALQLGGGHSIPLGGPFRSFVKAFTPNRDGVWGPNALQFARGKLNAPVSAPLDILRNSDFTGKDIYSGNATAPENIGKILAYLAENAVPLSAGQVLTDLRTGDLNKGTIERVGGQLIGGNLNPPTDYETAQENMRSQYENYNPVLTASDGKKVNYTKPEDLNDDPLFVKKYAIEHPRDPSSDVGIAIDAVINRNIEGSPGREAMQNNTAAAADKITLGQWKETRKEINHTIRYELGKATEGIDKGPAEPGTPRYWLDSYYKTFEEATPKDTGQLDTELLDQKQAEWLKANGPQALDYVHEYAQVGKDPIEKEYLAAMAKLGDEGYFSSGPNAIPRYISKVSQLSDKEIMELHDKASTAHAHEEKYQNIKSPDTAILLWMTEHGHSPAEILDVQNAGKKSKEAPQRTMYKALNKKILTWLDPNAYYSQTK